MEAPDATAAPPPEDAATPEEVSEADPAPGLGDALLSFFDMVQVKMRHAIVLRPVRQVSLPIAPVIERIEAMLEAREARLQKLMEMLGVDGRLEQGVSSEAQRYRGPLLDGADERPLIMYQGKRKKR